MNMIEFVKMHGLGNDYVYIDAINQGIIEPPEDELDDVEDIPIEEPENDEEEEEVPEEEPEEEVE